MSEHTCTELTEGCFRCELHLDEIAAWIDSLRVTGRGVVHDPDCTHVSGPCSNAGSWVGIDRLPGDRACRRCLPDGLPTLPTPIGLRATSEGASA